VAAVVDVVVDVAVREVAVGEAQQQIELSSRRRKAKTKEKKYDLFWKPLLFILCNNMYVNYYLVCLLFVVFSRFSVRCNFFFCRRQWLALVNECCRFSLCC
jgi:hypothetical protein